MASDGCVEVFLFLHYNGAMSVQVAPLGSIRITQHLDFEGTIELDGREQLGFSPRYPALVQLHEEMPAQDVPLHWHKGAEMLYARQGRLRVFVDGRSVTIEEGQFCLISPNARHAIHPMPRSTGQSVLSVTFDDRQIARLAPGLHDRYLKQGLPIGRGTAWPDADLELICEDLIVSLADDTSELRFIRAARLVFQLLEHIYTHYASESCELSAAAGSDAVDERIKPMVDFFDHNYASGVTVTQAAKEFGYSPEYFSRLFSKHAGMSPERYLTELRLQHAVDVLVSSRVSCSQIAQDSGFRSARAFSTAFFKRYGMMPSVFRRENHERLQEI